jgi:hypothetical protein
MNKNQSSIVIAIIGALASLGVGWIGASLSSEKKAEDYVRYGDLVMLESRNFPGKYVRHQRFVLKLNAENDTPADDRGDWPGDTQFTIKKKNDY